MKILIPIFKFSNSGGSRVLSQFANYWIAQGHEVTFVCLQLSSPPYYPTQAQIMCYDINGHLNSTTSVKISPIVKCLQFLHLGLVAEQRAMQRCITTLGSKYDVILATHALTAWPVHFAKVSSRKFYYIQAYETDYFMANGGLINRLLALYCAKTYALDDLEKIVNAPIYYSYKNLIADKFVACGLDLNSYYPKPLESITFDKDTIKIGAIGRLQIFKGTSYVLDAFKILRNKLGSKVELHLAFGNIELEDKENGVFIATPSGDQYLANYYREMDIIIAPGTSQYGAIHYPVIEAMACSTPIITTYYLPANECNAWLVAPHSISSIVDEVSLLINSPELAKKKASLALASIQSFEWNIVASKMLTFFQH